ncbi:hypothetical protein ACDP63_11225 [Paracoccus sp. P2]|uniref:hypothetical protein n=1 Tax=Paracoccus sp. P2 TaxID=3248840 RepID=UPI00391EEEDF
MASATKRIILSSGWVKIAEAKGREAMAMIDAYGAVQLAVADGEPPRGDVASGHSLNGSMMWPVKGAEIIWARGAGVAVSVTLLKVVPEFATLDSAALKVATASAQAVATAAAGAAATADAKAVTADNKATAADAKATEAKQVQARRDFGRWQLVDYLAIFLSPAEYDAVLAGDIASQNEIANTMAVQAMHNDFINWWSAANDRHGELVYPPVTIAVCDELFSEHFAQKLWDMTGAANGRCKAVIRGSGVDFQCKNWVGRAAVRTSGLYAERGITYPVPKVMFRWEQKGGNAFFPEILGTITLTGETSLATDPVGVKIKLVTEPRVDGLVVRSLLNHGIMFDGVMNGHFNRVTVTRTGYEPTEFGGEWGHIASNVTFSNVGAVVTASHPIFTADHVGRQFCLAAAGLSDQNTRLNHWSVIDSVDSPTQITLAVAPQVDKTGVRASFEAIRGSGLAGTNTVEMTATLTGDLTGRYISIIEANAQGRGGNRGVLSTQIVGHSGDTITIADTIRDDFTGRLIVFSPMIWADSFDDDLNIGRSDNIGIHDLRCECSPGTFLSSIPVIMGSVGLMVFGNTKLHGSSTDYNNFGGTAAGVVFGHARGVILDGSLEQTGHTPRWGNAIFVGDQMMVDLRGKLTQYPDDDGRACAYISPTIPAAQVYAEITWGLTPPSANFPQGNQMALRLGPNGASSMISAFGSERGKGLFPSRFGRVEASEYGGAGVVSSNTDASNGKVMLTGHGALSGTVQPPVASDLDTVSVFRRCVRATGATANKPDSSTYIVDLKLNTTGVYWQIAYAVDGSLDPKIAARWNNGSAWSPWRFINIVNSGGTGGRPGSPYLWQQYADTTLGKPIWWNGTAWVDATGTTV